MKKSNKILLLLFICFFGFIIAVQAILYVKYVNNNYTPQPEFDAYYYNAYNPGGIKHIRIEGMAQCQIIPANDVKLLIQKSNFKYAGYNVSGDTLIIKGFNPAEHQSNYKLYLSPQEVILYTPPGNDIYATNSNITIQGDTVRAKAASYHFVLNNTDLYTRFNDYHDSVNRYFDTVYVTAANRSGVYLFHNEYLKGLNIQLNNSVVNDLKAKIDSIHILSDSNSTVVVNGNNIIKLNSAVIRN